MDGDDRNTKICLDWDGSCESEVCIDLLVAALTAEPVKLGCREGRHQVRKTAHGMAVCRFHID